MSQLFYQQSCGCSLLAHQLSHYTRELVLVLTCRGPECSVVSQEQPGPVRIAWQNQRSHTSWICLWSSPSGCPLQEEHCWGLAFISDCRVSPIATAAPHNTQCREQSSPERPRLGLEAQSDFPLHTASRLCSKSKQAAWQAHCGQFHFPILLKWQCYCICFLSCTVRLKF